MTARELRVAAVVSGVAALLRGVLLELLHGLHGSLTHCVRPPPGVAHEPSLVVDRLAVAGLADVPKCFWKFGVVVAP